MPDLPPRVPPRIRSNPAPRQVYWCDFPEDAQLPEMWKRRPVVILSRRPTLYGVASVVPLTSKSQPDNPLAHPLPDPLGRGGTSWAVCSHLTAVAVSRLGMAGNRPPKVAPGDFTAILRLVLGTLPELSPD